MHNFNRRVALLLILAITVTAFVPAVFAAESTVEIAVADISFDKYIDADGVEHSDLGTVAIEFSKLELDGQLTLLLSTEEITDTSAASLSKIIYINQVDVPEQNIVSFPIDKARIADAIGTEEIDGCNLYLKVNGTGGSDAVAVETRFVDPSPNGMDITGDGKITVEDVLASMDMFAFGEYNEKADFNKDGKISLIDILRIIKLCAN